MATHSSLFLGNPVDRRAWWATVPGVSKESDMTQQLNGNSNQVLLKNSLKTSLSKTGPWQISMWRNNMVTYGRGSYELTQLGTSVSRTLTKYTHLDSRNDHIKLQRCIPMVLNWERFCSSYPRDTWQCVETCLVGTAAGGGATGIQCQKPWMLMNILQYNAQAHTPTPEPPRQRIIQPQMLRVLMLRHSDLDKRISIPFCFWRCKIKSKPMKTTLMPKRAMS